MRSWALGEAVAESGRCETSADGPLRGSGGHEPAAMNRTAPPALESQAAGAAGCCSFGG
jgi:hypothetical protein